MSTTIALARFDRAPADTVLTVETGLREFGLGSGRIGAKSRADAGSVLLTYSDGHDLDDIVAQFAVHPTAANVVMVPSATKLLHRFLLLRSHVRPELQWRLWMADSIESTLLLTAQIIAKFSESITPGAGPNPFHPQNADLRVESGNLDAKHVSSLFGVTVAQLARCFGVSPQRINATPDADGLQKKLAPFDRVARLRVLGHDEKTFRAWLRQPIKALEEKAPLELLLAGKGQKVADLVDNAIQGNPS